MHRFFVPHHQISGSEVTIEGADADQIKNVLRLKPGEEIEVLDGAGKVYAANIKEVRKDRITCSIASSMSVKNEPKVKIAIIQSIPRESKMDFIIQKCTELGVDKIIPCVSERTIIKLDDDRKDKRLVRWQRIAKEAAEQSSRGMIPTIEEVKRFKDALKESENYDLSIIPWELEEEVSIKDLLKKNKNAKSILIAIGPEGGFSKEEVELAKKSGFKPASLGKRILRTETAPVAGSGF